MIGDFLNGKRDVPAVGASFGLEPIMDTLLMQKNFELSGSQVYIIPINTVAQCLKVAKQLRAGGVKTDFSLGKKGVSKNLDYANSYGIPYVLIIGEDEITKGKVLLRDMQDGDEKLMSIEQVIKKLGNK